MIATFRRSWRRTDGVKAARAFMFRGVWGTTRSARAYLRANPRSPGALDSAPGTLRAVGRTRGTGAARTLGTFAVSGLAAHHDPMLLEGLVSRTVPQPADELRTDCEYQQDD